MRLLGQSHIMLLSVSQEYEDISDRLMVRNFDGPMRSCLYTLIIHFVRKEAISGGSESVNY
ncbi:hypothetical protein SAMN05443246_0250 [Paenibacillus sp. GP183]|nr:hypothetical protein SAMN05443246_0250 [Paenibacillus sp. GP183]